MFCPKCGSENRDDNSKFCRICGSDISLVPKAMSGNLPEPHPREQRRERIRHSRRRQYDSNSLMSEGIAVLFRGFGFLLAACALGLFARWAARWWFWLLIPAFVLIGQGVAKIVGAREEKAQRALSDQKSVQTNHVRSTETRPVAPTEDYYDERGARDTGELAPPPSVTENTTRQLDPRPRENQ